MRYMSLDSPDSFESDGVASCLLTCAVGSTRVAIVILAVSCRFAVDAASLPPHLPWMPRMCILICMRTTLNIHDETLKRAAELTGVREKTALVRLGLEALIARESSKRLAQLGATEKNLRAIPRRRATSD